MFLICSEMIYFFQKATNMGGKQIWAFIMDDWLIRGPCIRFPNLQCQHFFSLTSRNMFVLNSPSSEHRPDFNFDWLIVLVFFLFFFSKHSWESHARVSNMRLNRLQAAFLEDRQIISNAVSTNALYFSRRMKFFLLHVTCSRLGIEHSLLLQNPASEND